MDKKNSKQPAVEVLLDTVKELWYERCHLHIHIGLHTQCNCLELIFYEMCSGVEYPRVYLDYPGLKSKIDIQEYNELLTAKKLQNQQKQRRVANRTVENEVLNEILVNFIMDGLNIKAKPGAVGLLSLSLFNTSIEVKKGIPHSIERPVGLEPVYIQRPLLNTVEDVKAKMHGVRPDQRRQMVDERFLSVVAVSSIADNAISRPNYAELDKFCSKAIKRFREIVRKIIRLIAVQKAEWRIQNSSLCDWYQEFKQKVESPSGKRARMYKMRRKLLMIMMLSKPSTSIDTYKLPDVRRSHRQRRSMSDFRNHRRNRSEGDGHLQELESGKHIARAGGVNFPSVARNGVKSTFVVEGSNKSAAHKQSNKNVGVRVPRYSTIQGNGSIISLIPDRINCNDPFFVKENQQVRALSPINLDGRKDSTAQRQQHEEAYDSVADAMRLYGGTGSSLPAVSSSPRSPHSLQSHERASSPAMPSLKASFATQMTKLDQNVKRSKFENRLIGKRLGSWDDFEVDYNFNRR